MKYFKAYLLTIPVALIAVVICAGDARGQSGTTIQACYDKLNGQLRIAAPSQCKPSELPISWNVQTALNHDSTLAGDGATTPLSVAPGGVTTAQLSDGSVTAAKIAPGQVVKSLNGLADHVTLAAGPNVNITPAGNTLTISAAGAGSVAHDQTLAGDGTRATPLGVSVPLVLHSENGTVITATSDGGVGVEGAGGNIGIFGKRGIGSGWNLTQGGAAVIGDSDSDGVLGIGRGTGVAGVSLGAGQSGVLGRGGGGGSESHPGVGVDGFGGTGSGSEGGEDTSGGTGVRGTGGTHDVKGGYGVLGVGGDTKSDVPDSVGGTGIVGMGGKGFQGVRNGLAGLFEGDVRVEGGAQVTGNVKADGFVYGYILGHKRPGAISNVDQAGLFEGDVRVEGNLSVSGTKDFIIDHPLDPENKYLVHAAIESSEVLDLYTGKVTLGADGTAVVSFPEWFEALNRDFRYSLTPVGAPAPDLHVARELSGNSFKIAGGAPGMKVSWQVVGVRSDAAMLRRPFRVEEDKPAAERGTYLNPEASARPRGTSPDPGSRPGVRH